MKSNSEVLQEVAELLTPEVWVKGSVCIPPGGKGHTPEGDKVINDTSYTKLCIDGALRTVVFGDSDAKNFARHHIQGTAESGQYMRLRELLRNQVGRIATPDMDGVIWIEGYNDHETTTYEDVQLLLKRTKEEIDEE